MIDTTIILQLITIGIVITILLLQLKIKRKLDLEYERLDEIECRRLDEVELERIDKLEQKIDKELAEKRKDKIRARNCYISILDFDHFKICEKENDFYYNWSSNKTNDPRGLWHSTNCNNSTVTLNGKDVSYKLICAIRTGKNGMIRSHVKNESHEVQEEFGEVEYTFEVKEEPTDNT